MQQDKIIKMLNDILKDLNDLKKKVNSDFIKIDIALLEEKIKKLTK